ncbi:MAG: sulfotransferase domain-containing protein [Nonlabens sp.]
MGLIYDVLDKRVPLAAVILLKLIPARRSTVEYDIIKRQSRLPERNGNTSIIFFSTHKAGSSIANRLLKRLANKNGLTTIDYDSFIAVNQLDENASFNNPSFLDRAFLPSGYYYGCFRTFREIPNIENFKVIVQLRDPRDLLVSHYYNVRDIRTNRSFRAHKERQVARKGTIDDHVLKALPRFKKVMQDYQEFYDSQEEAYFTTFEKMIRDPEKWYEDIASFAGMDLEQSLIKHINKTIKSIPEKKNHTNHHRSARPGEHRRKLEVQTIEILNRELAEVISFHKHINQLS